MWNLLLCELDPFNSSVYKFMKSVPCFMLFLHSYFLDVCKPFMFSPTQMNILGHVVTNWGNEMRFHADRMSLLSGRRLTKGSIKARLNHLPPTTTAAFLQGAYLKERTCFVDFIEKTWYTLNLLFYSKYCIVKLFWMHFGFFYFETV